MSINCHSTFTGPEVLNQSAVDYPAPAEKRRRGTKRRQRLGRTTVITRRESGRTSACTCAPQHRAVRQCRCYNVPSTIPKIGPSTPRDAERTAPGVSKVSRVSGRPWDATPNRWCAEAGEQLLDRLFRRATPLARQIARYGTAMGECFTGTTGARLPWRSRNTTSHPTQPHNNKQA